MKEIKNCPICDGTNLQNVMKCKDHTVSKQTFSISECSTCGFWFTNPIPQKEAIGDYYKSEEYVSHTSTKKGLINRLYHIVRKRALVKKFKLVNKEKSGNRLLDIGCGTGDFLAYCHSQKMDVLGLEPDSDARNIAQRKVEDKVKDLSELQTLSENQFDVITMWHVLEHVYDLNDDIIRILNLLKEDGVLIVAVPNRNSFDAKKYKENWAAYDLPRHLYHFREADIETLFKKHSADLKRTIPMKYDSYYVSMLSQKIMGKGIIGGVISGWISNLKAKNNTYSSQIYVIRKQNTV